MTNRRVRPLLLMLAAASAWGTSACQSATHEARPGAEAGAPGDGTGGIDAAGGADPAGGAGVAGSPPDSGVGGTGAVGLGVAGATIVDPTGGVGGTGAVSSGLAGATTVDPIGGAGGTVATLAEGECRGRSDCPADTVSGTWVVWTCVSPFATPPDPYVSPIPPCTIPGLGDCPTNASPLPVPVGSGTACASSSDCAFTDDSGVLVATQCVDGACTACAADGDCPVEQPVCVQVAAAEVYTTCVTCVIDDDCPAERPFCVGDSTPGGRCVACKLTSDCADGACVERACVPECQSDADCPDPARPCSPQHRCERRACGSDADCAPNMICTPDIGLCERAPCASDTDCDAGVCVNAVCHERYGSCASQIRGA